MLQTATIETAGDNTEHLTPLHPVGAVAATIERLMDEDGGPPILYVARSSRRAREIAELLALFARPARTALFPQWDGFAADGVPPSAAAIGMRMSVLRWLLDRKHRPAAVVTTAAALLRRVPPRSVWKDVHLEFRIGDPIDVDDVRERLASIGYRMDERVDEPGEAAVRGRVVEVFSAAAPRPCRVEHEEGRITAIRSYDPLSQRSLAEVEHLIVDPAGEFIGDETPEEEEIAPASLASFYRKTETVFDYLPDARIVLEDGVERRAADAFALIEEGDDEEAVRDTLRPQDWARFVAGEAAAVVEDPDQASQSAHVPTFATEDEPAKALGAFAEPFLAKGYRIALAGPAGQTMRLWARRTARALEQDLVKASTWQEIRDAPRGALLRLEMPIGESFVAHEDGIVVVALRDLAGQAGAGEANRGNQAFSRDDEHFGIGDAVVHFDHGIGILEGVETVGEGADETEALKLRYADDATLLVPFEEIDALWRYGGSAADVSLDKLKGEGWSRKRDKIVGEIASTAERMVALLREKDEVRCKPLSPDRQSFERFCARFPYELTHGQAAASEAVLSDLRSGRPMDRLLCGDVGFGKTEVALRAAAAAVFAGRQVAIVAPTTILARQHFEVFEKRFARQGIEVALLSRLASSAEARDAKRGVADGTVRVLVATHAICGKDVSFEDLALVVIDEEQRFGSRHKQAIRDLAPGLHVLSMTATPIPRTLQAGFVGLHDISVIATPPVRRRPVRTFVQPFADEPVRDALLAERRRGGQSFLVCPRIEDLEPMAERLGRIVPDLSVTILHGEMPPAEVDAAMLDFAGGRGDVLLSTSIVESGLDVPSANTIILFRPDRFGLAQLHQLRGRVGRGVKRGVAILAMDRDDELSENARQRLATVERLNALGSGFELSMRDLDLRGAGELLGEEQAGHLQLVGLSLYRRMLERALLAARGEKLPDEWRADLNLGVRGTIPSDYLPEPELRIELAAALDRVSDETALVSLKSDVADRFGPLPPVLETSFALAALRLRCAALGIRRLDAGPKAVAATFARNDADDLQQRVKPKKNDSLRWSENRLVLDEESEDAEGRLAAVEALLERIA